MKDRQYIHVRFCIKVDKTFTDSVENTSAMKTVWAIKQWGERESYQKQLETGWLS